MAYKVFAIPNFRGTAVDLVLCNVEDPNANGVVHYAYTVGAEEDAVSKRTFPWAKTRDFAGRYKEQQPEIVQRLQDGVAYRPGEGVLDSEDGPTFASDHDTVMRLGALELLANLSSGRLSTTDKDPFPHQLALQQYVKKPPRHNGLRRILIADEVGLGKTIEVGLILRDILLARGKLEGFRCLYLTSGGLVDDAAEKLRDVLSGPSGGKDDPTDAALLAQFLGHHSGQLRPWKPDTTATRKLAAYCEHRRKIVEERKRLSQQLTSRLKLYFPLLIELFLRNIQRSAALLKRWDTLAKLRRVHPKTLRTFLKQQGIRNDEKRTEIIEAVRAALPLTTDAAIVEPNALFALSLAKQIEQLNGTIEQFDEQIANLVAEHDDAALFRALPGAGDALVPRLIVALGSDRGRYDAAEEIQSHSGIAPVTRQSGKTRHVSRRYACPKFLRQTFHEFADHARKWSAWSKAFYAMKLAAGFKHHAAVRALAYKWIRIIFRLWKTHTIYDENVYIAQLRKRNSPVVNFLKIA